jgi:hypothetical protein
MTACTVRGQARWTASLPIRVVVHDVALPLAHSTLSLWGTDRDKSDYHFRKSYWI